MRLTAIPTYPTIFNPEYDPLPSKVNNGRARTLTESERKSFSKSSCHQGKMYMDDGKFIEARIMLDSAIKMDPNNLRARTYLIFCYQILNPELGITLSKSDAKAQLSIGLMYYEGHGVIKDGVQAIEWFRRSAMNGNSDAAYNIAVMFCKGMGVAKSVKRGIKWLRIAADLGSKTARSCLQKLPIAQKR